MFSFLNHFLLERVLKIYLILSDKARLSAINSCFSSSILAGSKVPSTLEIKRIFELKNLWIFISYVLHLLYSNTIIYQKSFFFTLTTPSLDKVHKFDQWEFCIFYLTDLISKSSVYSHLTDLISNLCRCLAQHKVLA